jgi:hypothetical protein
MTPGVRKFTLTAHVASSVGWLGSVAAYLAVALAGLTSQDPQMVRAAYLITALIGWLVIVPLSFAALLTGLVQSLGTEWGLFRHYWIVSKFALTVGAIIVLLVHMQTVSRMAQIAVEVSLSGGDHRDMRKHLVLHAAGALIVLLTTTVLSIYKPWGRTPYGRRVQLQRQTATARMATSAEPNAKKTGPYVLVAIIALLVVMLVLHFAGGG